MRIYNIKVNGKKYEVKVMGISEVEPVEVTTVKAEVPKSSKPVTESKPALQAASSTSGTSIVAPMQGTILSVLVKVGDQVKAGQNVCVLEAMKLENEIKSPVDGVVKEVLVSKSSPVNAKDVLIVLE